MNTVRLKRLQLQVFFAALLLLRPGQVELASASDIPAVYREAFQRLHDEHPPEWTGMKDVNAWFELEKKRIEQLTLEWLGAAHDTVEWRRGLFLSHKLASVAVCGRVFESVQDELVQVAAPETHIRSESHVALAGPIVVLASCGDARVLPALHRLVADPLCLRPFVEEYLRALRSIGDAASVGVIQGLAVRKTDATLDRAAGLTEKVILAKVARRSILGDADEKLRTLTAAWIGAIETRNMQAYLNVLPFGARAGVDEYDFTVELLQSPELPDILEAARRAAKAQDGAFQVQGDRLEASIVVDDRYKFVYILEVDGWKIFGPVGAGP